MYGHTWLHDVIITITINPLPLPTGILYAPQFCSHQETKIAAAPRTQLSAFMILQENRESLFKLKISKNLHQLLSLSEIVAISLITRLFSYHAVKFWYNCVQRLGKCVRDMAGSLADWRIPFIILEVKYTGAPCSTRWLMAMIGKDVFVFKAVRWALRHVKTN